MGSGKLSARYGSLGGYSGGSRAYVDTGQVSMVAVKTSPITPSVLAWSIAQDGRSRIEIAHAAKVGSRALEAWASGESQPSVGQLTELANTLRRPRVFFFLPEPPARAGLPSGFRHQPGAGSRTVSAAVLMEARRAERLQRAMASTIDQKDAPRVPSADVRDDPAEAARTARQWLVVGENERWPDEYAALRRWRNAFEAAGVLVFELRLGKDDDEVRGFAYWDDRAPMVVVNSSSVSPPARIFTLGHELAHLFLREATACVEPTGDNLIVDDVTERWCKRFAASLIMPGTEIRNLMAEMAVGRGEADLNAVKAVMTAFRSSARAAAVRLSDLGYAQHGLYPAVVAAFRTSRRKSTGTPKSPPRHRLRLRQYGADRRDAPLLASPERRTVGPADDC